MSEVAVRSPMSDKIAYASALADSGLLPAAYRRNPANVLYAVEYGEMLGLPPMAAITGIHVIEGRPSASAGLISALVRRAGHRLRVEGDDQQATAEITRSDDPEFAFRAVWTLDRARQAGLAGKGVWRQYPAAMLKARAITEVARDACEEALCGMHYTPEELGADDADAVTMPGPAGHLPMADGIRGLVEGATTPEELRVLWQHAAGDPDLRREIEERAVTLGQEAPGGQTGDQSQDDPVEAEIVDETITRDWPAVEDGLRAEATS